MGRGGHPTVGIEGERGGPGPRRMSVRVSWSRSITRRMPSSPSVSWSSTPPCHLVVAQAARRRARRPRRRAVLAGRRGRTATGRAHGGSDGWADSVADTWTTARSCAGDRAGRCPTPSPLRWPIAVRGGPSRPHWPPGRRPTGGLRTRRGGAARGDARVVPSAWTGQLCRSGSRRGNILLWRSGADPQPGVAATRINVGPDVAGPEPLRLTSVQHRGWTGTVLVVGALMAAALLTVAGGWLACTS